MRSGFRLRDRGRAEVREDLLGYEVVDFAAAVSHPTMVPKMHGRELWRSAAVTGEFAL